MIVIRRQNEAKEGFQPVGYRSVELHLSLCLQ